MKLEREALTLKTETLRKYIINFFFFSLSFTEVVGDLTVMVICVF